MTSAELYCKGAQVWLADPAEVWLPGKVVEPLTDGHMVVEREQGGGCEEVMVCSSADLPPLRNPDILVGANDLTSLSYLHEAAVLHNLQVRFLQSNTIYTYCGIVLVAINPYQQLPIYGSEIVSAYSGREMGEMDPHIFAVAEEAFKRMARDNSNHSIIVSGESGAGKTVSAKYTMRYFASLGGASAETQIERKVLASNPIMEAIGNAKTTRNDNSSRFGKYIEIGFSKDHRITGASMRTYLLEKSRVVCHSSEERNYHIFYQLCASRHLSELQEFELGPAEDFHYTNQGDCIEISDVDDQSELSTTREALRLLGFHDDHQQHLFQVLASILHLGNVEITDNRGEEESKIDPDDPHLLTAASLLGVEAAELQKWLCNRRIATSQDIYTKPLTPAQAITARDGLSKHLYAHLFQWVVNLINCSLQSSTRQHAFIGVLDIYGFEVLEWNSFEQFCINYANEKLQQQFNMHVFKLEQREYVRENIEWSFIDFYDNQPCINLIESKLGILDLLDETCRMPRACDQLLMQKLYHTHEGKNGHFSKPRTSNSAFQVHHYAGTVEYEGEGFVGKNNDCVIEEHITLLKSSKHKFVSQLFQPQGQKRLSSKVTKPRGRKGSGMITKPTVGSQFHDSLSELMKTLDCTTPHYVRCIKPNDCKMPFTFDPQRAVQQLRACGVLETIRISAAGYPSRWLYSDFFERYRMLLPSGLVRREDGKQMCEYILHRNIKDEDKYRFGLTKIFFRAGQVAYLEKLRSNRLHSSGVLIQKHIRGWLQRKKFVSLRQATIRMQAHARGLLARRRAEYLRQTRAATVIQKHVRCFILCQHYHRLRHATITIQACYRGRQGRMEYTALLRETKAVVLQRYLRGWLARRVYQCSLRYIVKTQCCVRRWLAQRELKRLKIQARSVDYLKKLNRGMENKIIELQQKLSKQLDLNGQLADSNRHLESAQRCKAEALQEAKERVQEVERELSQERERSTTLEEQLNAMREKQEKEVAAYQQQLEQLRQELQEANTALRDTEPPLPSFLSSQSYSDSAYQKLELELAELRDHHQDVLKDFADLEQRCAQLQRELESKPPQTLDIGNVTEVFSDSVLSPPFPKSLTSTAGKLNHASSLPHLPTSTPGNHLGFNLNISLLDANSNPTPATLTSSDKGTLVLSDVKQMITQLEQERDLLKKDKDILEKKLAESLLQSPVEDSFVEKIRSENECLKQEIANLKLAQDGHMQSFTRDREFQMIKQSKASLVNEVASLRQALRQSSTTSSFNISLQQEVTRLTEENLNLLESLEVIQKERVHKPRGGIPLTPLSPRRRINPCGAGSPEKRTPVKYRALQEKPYLGILSWQPADQSKLVRALILDLKPELVQSHSLIPCLPAHVIFMCLRYPDHCANEEQALNFMEGVVRAIQQVTQNHHGSLDLLAFWLANTCRLMHNLRQYSGEQQLIGSPQSYQSNQSCLSNYDLTEYRYLLSDRAVSIYHEIVQLISSRIQPLVVPGLLEYEAIPGISNSRPIGSKRCGSHDSMVTTETVTKELTSVLGVLERNYVDPHTVGQIMKQAFRVIGSSLLNNLLLRRDMCHWSKGIQIRYNISQLEEWSRTHGMVRSGVVEQLQPVVQAVKLLQMRKSNEEDVKTICELCCELNPLQIQKILSMYTPANEYEERVPVSVIRLVNQRSGADRADPAHLMADVNHILPIDFLYTPSDVSFQTLTIPKAINLDFVVKI